MNTVASFLLFVLMSLLLSALWIGVAWALIRLLKLVSPVSRVFVLIAPLLASSLALLRLMPEARQEILTAMLLIAVILSARDLFRYLGYRRRITIAGVRYSRGEALCEPLSSGLGLGITPFVYLSDNLDTGPVVLGVMRPVIVFPLPMVDQLDDEEMSVLIAHELGHIHRRDMLLKWVLLFLRRLAFWNPVALWSYRMLSLEIEYACDRIACRLTGKPGTLARTLCKIQDMHTLDTPLPASRMEMIPGAALGLRARIDYLHADHACGFQWSNLVKTLLIFSVYWAICARPAEFLLSIIN